MFGRLTLTRRKRPPTDNTLMKHTIAVAQQCSSWPAFSILVLLHGLQVNDDTLLIIAKIAFEDGLFSKHTDALRLNCLEILVDACTCNECIFSDNTVDYVIGQAILSKRNNFDAVKLRSAISSLAAKSPKAVKAAYDKYSTFNNYRV